MNIRSAAIAALAIFVSSFSVVNVATAVPSQCTTVINLTNGLNIKYKESNFHGGRGPSFIMGCQAGAKQYWPRARRFSVYDQNGTEVGKFVNFDSGHHTYGSRSYTGLPGGYPKTARKLRASALASGSSNIYINVKNGICFKVNNPTENQGTIKPVEGRGRC